MAWLMFDLRFTTLDYLYFFQTTILIERTNLEILDSLKYLAHGKVYGCPSKTIVSTAASNMDYVYVGSGLRDDNKDPTHTPLLFDYHDNHPDSAWFNVLYIDGHAQGYSGDKWQEITGMKIEDVPKRQK
jgi:prepilin-type processing-associated H-X9-DG protein